MKVVVMMGRPNTTFCCTLGDACQSFPSHTRQDLDRSTIVRMWMWSWIQMTDEDFFWNLGWPGHPLIWCASWCLVRPSFLYLTKWVDDSTHSFLLFRDRIYPTGALWSHSTVFSNFFGKLPYRRGEGRIESYVPGWRLWFGTFIFRHRLVCMRGARLRCKSTTGTY